MKDNRNKALLFSRVEGGTMHKIPFDIYEDELSQYDKVIKKEVFSKVFQQKFNTRVIQFGKLFIKALFFEDGSVYDVDLGGFKKRENYTSEDTATHFKNIYEGAL